MPSYAGNQASEKTERCIIISPFFIQGLQLVLTACAVFVRYLCAFFENPTKHKKTKTPEKLYFPGFCLHKTKEPTTKVVGSWHAVRDSNP